MRESEQEKMVEARGYLLQSKDHRLRIRGACGRAEQQSGMREGISLLASVLEVGR